MEIDQEAPAVAEAEIAIRAPLETVWRIQTDIDSWSQWNPKIQRARLGGPFAVDSVFKWKSGGASIVSTLREIEPMRRIAWTGKAMRARARHIWDFEPRGDVVLVRTQESFDGWWPRLLPGLTRRMLDSILRAWLQSLKQRAEFGE
ncbi:SRPBCC family protein [Sphingobium sp. AS12]|uniref:SRPBCC family protein n=1 Tax=Sphingobium sp. AS12 TaxID=2849495 RepID=UPI001C3197CC|nr:SRPBCC family protein [Sphingobium sp. AS12]MBV2150128.1 SRPBCC family protein [Sphingobium sp. AS12]